MKLRSALFAGLSVCAVTSAHAADLEVTHWWTSGGEAAAVAEFAKAFDATGHRWVDGAIAGGGGTARPIMISRILGGDPMGATQFNHGQQAQELVEAGLMRDMTEVAEAGNWREVIHPQSLLDSCTIDGRIYCAPINIHSQQWLWLNNGVFEQAGLPVPTTWDEFAEAAPTPREAGIIPMAIGQQPWQTTLTFQVLMVALAGPEAYTSIFGDRDVELARSDEIARVFEAAATAREMSAGSNVQDWNQATNMVITGRAAGQIMGDWAQGEFAVAGQTAGEEYTCLPGLGVNRVIMTGGDAFYFPNIDNDEVREAQDRLAEVMISAETQVAFNLKKGSLPIRGDVDLEAANDCMKQGLEILASGSIISSPDQLMDPDSLNSINDLFVEFFNDTSVTAEAAQARFADLVAAAQ
jgi:glucose/mannose transport system substrate-binding protein